MYYGKKLGHTESPGMKLDWHLVKKSLSWNWLFPCQKQKPELCWQKLKLFSQKQKPNLSFLLLVFERHLKHFKISLTNCSIVQATESTYDFWNILLFNSLTQFVTIFWNYLLAVAFVVKKIHLLLKSWTEELNCS